MKTAVFAHPEVAALDLEAHLPAATTELVTGDGLPLEASVWACAMRMRLPVRVFPRMESEDALREEILGYANCVLAVSDRREYLRVPGVERALALGIPVAVAPKFTRS